MTDIIITIVIILLTIICFTAMIVKEVRQSNRQAPYGKVFVRDFMEMVDDIETAILDSKIEYISVVIGGLFEFKVRIDKETPYQGLEYETIPMYRSHAIYIDDELVCRAHVLDIHCKKRAFIEFSSKRKREEVIDILKSAHVVAKEYNRKNISKWFSKYDSKSFYNYSSSEDAE